MIKRIESAPLECGDEQLCRDITRAVREVDEMFKTCGGSNRHWVIECFLPAPDENGLKVILKGDPVMELDKPMPTPKPSGGMVLGGPHYRPSSLLQVW